MPSGSRLPTLGWPMVGQTGANDGEPLANQLSYGKSPCSISINGGVLEWGFPQIIHFKRIFHSTTSILGDPHLWKPLRAMLVYWRLLYALRSLGICFKKHGGFTMADQT